MIGKNKNGWAVPYALKIQMCIIGSSELGACGLMKEIKDGNMYMQTSSVADGLRIFVVEEIIYEIFFSMHVSP